MDCIYTLVGEHSECGEGEATSFVGAFRKANVGMSNDNEGEKPSRRKTKVSLAMSISQGLVGPKGMVKTAPDGYMVNIP